MSITLGLFFAIDRVKQPFKAVLDEDWKVIYPFELEKLIL